MIRQKTLRTTLGMFFAGSLVSPAVTAMDSVPPLVMSAQSLSRIMDITYKANEAVTKTDAKPPIPSTKGASST